MSLASGLGGPYSPDFIVRPISLRRTITTGTVFKLTPAGTKSIFASGLNRPIGLAFDSSGNLFVADQFSNAIFKFTPDGIKSTFASGLSGPVGLAFDSAGNLFETDYNSGSILNSPPMEPRARSPSG